MGLWGPLGEILEVTPLEAPFLSDGQLESFVQKLAEFRGALSQPEQRVLDAMLASGGTDAADVQGYGLVQDAPVRQAAVAAVDRLSRAVGGLQPSPQGLFQRLAQFHLPFGYSDPGSSILPPR